MTRVSLDWSRIYRRIVDLAFLAVLISVLAWPMPPSAAAKESEDESSTALLQETALGVGGFSMSLQILDPVSWEPKGTFFFGDKAGYEITLNIPSEAEGKKATIKLTATAKIGGVILPFTASQVFTGPVTNPTYEKGDIYQPREWKGTFDIPNDIPVPELTATVKLVVTIDDVGSSTITKKITLKTRQKLSKPAPNYPPTGQAWYSYAACGAASYYTSWYFSWNEVRGATKYEIAIRNTMDGSKFTFETEEKHYWGNSPCTGSYPQHYAWKVRAGNEYCWSAWSEERTFSITH